MNFRTFVLLAKFLPLLAQPGLGQKPPEIAQHAQVIAPGVNLTTTKTVTISMESRRKESPESLADLEQLRIRLLHTLSDIPLTVVAEGARADLTLAFILDTHMRYGMFNYQIRPYVYLLARNAASQRLEYCSFQRAGVFRSASQRLLHEFKRAQRGKGSISSGSLAECAEQAMRPL